MLSTVFDVIIIATVHQKATASIIICTDHLSGLGTAMGLVCVCVCPTGRTTISGLTGFRRRHLERWFTLTPSRSRSKVKVIAQKFTVTACGVFSATKARYILTYF